MGIPLSKSLISSCYLKKLVFTTGLPHTQGIQGTLKLKNISGNFKVEENL